MNQALHSFHQAHKERIARIEARAYRPPVVVASESRLVEPVVETAPIGKPWFRIIGLVEPTIRDVQEVVCEFYRVERNDLVSARRDMPICFYRQVAMFIAKELTQKSLPEIGRRFGDRDHTTVLSAKRKIARLIEADRELADEITEIKSRIEAL